MVSYARQYLQQADRASWAAALDALARYDRADRVGLIGVPGSSAICNPKHPVRRPGFASRGRQLHTVMWSGRSLLAWSLEGPCRAVIKTFGRMAPALSC